MNWSSIKETVGKVAPLAGTLLGGPAGAAVGSLISSALGVENNPDAVATALASPEATVKLRELESNERQHLLQMQVETLRLELADVQHARSTHVNSRMPAVVTMSLTAICAALIFMLMWMPVPSDNRDMLVQSLGTVLGFWGASLAYWVGTTRSSSDKTRIITGS